MNRNTPVQLLRMIVLCTLIGGVFMLSMGNMVWATPLQAPAATVPSPTPTSRVPDVTLPERGRRIPPRGSPRNIPPVAPIVRPTLVPTAQLTVTVTPELLPVPTLEPTAGIPLVTPTVPIPVTLPETSGSMPPPATPRNLMAPGVLLGLSVTLVVGTRRYHRRYRKR